MFKRNFWLEIIRISFNCLIFCLCVKFDASPRLVDVLLNELSVKYCFTQNTVVNISLKHEQGDLDFFLSSDKYIYIRKKTIPSGSLLLTYVLTTRALSLIPLLPSLYFKREEMGVPHSRHQLDTDPLNALLSQDFVNL